MRTIELYLKLKEVEEKCPMIYSNLKKQNIARALLFTQGSIDEVEFLTNALKVEIIEVYQIMKEAEIQLPQSNQYGEKREASVNYSNTKKKARSFKRSEMVNFVKDKLMQSHPDIEFINLKYNILTCKLNDKLNRIYISTSRDYEFLNSEEEIKPHRVSAWHKGNDKIFTSCDYYAMLVKVDEKSKYVTEQDNGIEGIFMSQQELNAWLDDKEKNQSGMINCYVHYYQPESNRHNIEVVDTRERPKLNLNHLLNRAYELTD